MGTLKKIQFSINESIPYTTLDIHLPNGTEDHRRYSSWLYGT
jgi:hypothetical protein